MRVIKFGHNDQKNTSGVTFEQYQANLINFARQIQDLGGNPVSNILTIPMF